MSNWQTSYWWFFNVLGRFVGVWFIAIGGIVFLYAVSQGDWLTVCFTALGPIFGILLLCAKPYRPYLPRGDSEAVADTDEKTK